MSTIPEVRWVCGFGGRAQLISLPESRDARGKLLPFNFSALPFVPRRCFCISEVPVGTERGGHAHRIGSQLLVCLHGQVDVLMRDGAAEALVSLNDNSSGLLIGPRIWAQQTYRTEQAILLVFASQDYDPTSYIHEISDRT